MAITGETMGREATPAELRTECIREMLVFAGSAANLSGTISARQDAESVLAEALPDAEVLNLSGISLDQILTFPAEELPVLVELEDGSAMLIIGFNEFNVVVMDPSADAEPVYKIGKNDATEFFGNNGNRFYTYRELVD